jgi:hypothetical protein
MPTVQSFGSWKTGGPAVSSGMLTANRRKRAEYLDYLNAQANNISGPPAGVTIPKNFSIRMVLANSIKDRPTFCNACNDYANANTR